MSTSPNGSFVRALQSNNNIVPNPIMPAHKAPAAVAARIEKMRKAQWAAGADEADRALAAVAGEHPSRALVQRLIVDEHAWNAVTTEQSARDSN